ncbi:MAG: hypothetical protein AMJ65_17255 [Phycisphaerae bacterium SG8_4]|nr:MAG: hypothetical protein AMJ65_17255 [Phycisphaerae bacterium SG8_4]
MTAGILVFLSFVAAVITFAQVADRAQIQEEFRRRLSESDGVSVYVSVIAKEKSEEESMTSQLQEDVEGLLEDSEIKIITEEDLEYTPGRPRLGVYLVMYQEPRLKGVYLFSFRVVHFEDASLARNYKFAEGICWDSGLYIGRERTSVMRGVVKTHVRKYINDYLGANPKPPKREKQEQIRY